MSEIGRLSVILAFLCSCYAVVSIAWGLKSGLAGPLRSGRRAVWIVCGLTLLATLVLERALIARDFSYRYVAERSSTSPFPTRWARSGRGRRGRSFSGFSS